MKDLTPHCLLGQIIRRNLSAWCALALAVLAPAAPAGTTTLPAHPGEFAGAAPAPAQPLSIWFRRPGTNWEAHALPVGNGRIGAMVFGGVSLERIPFNEDSLWTGNADNRTGNSGNTAARGLFQAFGYLQIAQAAPLAAGGPTPVGDYRRDLDLTTGIATTEFTQSGVRFRRETFASHPDQVIVTRLSADRPGLLSARLSLVGAHGETTAAQGLEMSFAGALNNGLPYACRVRVLARGGRAAAEGGELVLEGCDEAVIILGTATGYVYEAAKNFLGELPAELLQTRVAAAAARPWDDLRARQVADFQSLFNRMDAQWGRSAPAVLALPTNERLAAYKAGGADPTLEQILLQYGRYLLISSSRRPGLPANLQGLWNDRNNPSWGSDYHTNINIQMNYWPAEPANLSECALPLFDLMLALRPPLRAASRAEFGDVRGFTMRTELGPYGGMSYRWNNPASAWLAQHFWEHYLFTQDPAFLRETAYPYLKEVTEFWVDRLKKLPDGTYVVPLGWSPEHGPTEDGVAHDQQIVWDLFTSYVAAANVLGEDAAFRGQVADLRAHLAGPKIGRWGQLQEWLEDKDDPANQHRHTSHLHAVYPGHQINLTETPDLAKAAAVSLTARGTAGDSRRQWAWAWRCALWARLHEPQKCYEMIRSLFQYNTLDNLLGNHPPMQMDGNWGITAAICEMLLQSQANELELLPALPREWPAGSFRGMRARGAFEVDAAWADGRLVSATIKSLAGRPTKVRYAGKVVDLHLPAGQSKTFGPEL